MFENMAAELNVKVQDFQAKLKTKGWNINAKAIEECMQELRGQDNTTEAIIKWAVHCDLKEIGSKILPEEVKRGQVQAVEGPLVLQIQKIRNISAPKANEESGAAPRLLKLQLSDGHTTCFGLEHSFMQKLSASAHEWSTLVTTLNQLCIVNRMISKEDGKLIVTFGMDLYKRASIKVGDYSDSHKRDWKNCLSTPPGTKIRLKGTVPLLCGFMLLEPQHVEVLGGKVEKLILKWETHKNVSQQRAKPGMLNDDGPPLFIAFNPKATNRYEKKTISKLNNQNTQNLLSDQRNDSDKKSEDKKENAAFEHSRDQRIESAKRSSEKQIDSTKTEKNPNKILQLTGNQRGRPDSWSDKDQRKTEKDVGIKLNRPTEEVSSHNQTNKCVRDAKFSDKRDGQKYEETNIQGKRPSFHKGGRRDDDFNDDYSTSRPSEGTLWDFLETKLPSKTQETENVKQKNSAVDNLEKGKSHDNRYASAKRDGQYRGEQPHQQRHEKLTISTGNKFEKNENQSIRDNYRKNQGEKQRQYEQRDQLRNNEEVNKQRNKENDRSQNQFRNQQKHDDKIPLEKSFHNQNNKQEQCPEKNNYNHDNRRNATQPSAARKQPEVKRENQSGRTGRNRDSSDQQSSQMDGSYKKNYTKYDQTDHKKLDGADNTQKSARAEYNAPNYRNRREKQGRVGEAGEVKQSTESYRERTGTGGQNPRQSENQKENRHSGKTQYKQNKDASNREKEDADKRTDKNTTKNAREDIKQTSKNKHWWKEGEDCMVFRPENGQYFLARIVKVEVRFRSCIVVLQDNSRQETISWSNLFPLDIPANRGHSFQEVLPRSHVPYPSPAHGPPQFNQTRPPFPGNYPAHDSMMRQRSQRPTQEFYRPPRGAKE